MDGLIDRGYPLTDQEAEEYAHVYGDSYWWGGPNQLPLREPPPLFRAAKVGRALVESLKVYNGGMLRLGDPKYLDKQEISADDAKNVKRGTILKARIECLYRGAHRDSKPTSKFHLAARDETGFTITQFGNRSFAMYAQKAIWALAAETERDGLASFSLKLNTGASYSVGLETDYSAAIKMVDADLEHGVKELPLNRTTVTRGEIGEAFDRIARVAIYQPLIVPRRRFGIDLDDFRHA